MYPLTFIHDYIILLALLDIILNKYDNTVPFVIIIIKYISSACDTSAIFLFCCAYTKGAT